MSDQPNVNTASVIAAVGNFLVAWDWSGTPTWRSPDGFVSCDEREIYALVSQKSGAFVSWQTYADAEPMRGTKTRQARPNVFRLTPPGTRLEQFAIQKRNGPRSWRRCFARTWTHRGNVFAVDATEALHVAALAGFGPGCYDPKWTRAERLRK